MMEPAYMTTAVPECQVSSPRIGARRYRGKKLKGESTRNVVYLAGIAGCLPVEGPSTLKNQGKAFNSRM